jgi:hypothetical protein
MRFGSLDSGREIRDGARGTGDAGERALAERDSGLRPGDTRFRLPPAEILDVCHDVLGRQEGLARTDLRLRRGCEPTFGSKTKNDTQPDIIRRTNHIWQQSRLYTARILKMLWGGSGEPISIAALTNPMEPRDDEIQNQGCE